MPSNLSTVYETPINSKEIELSAKNYRGALYRSGNNMNVKLIGGESISCDYLFWNCNFDSFILKDFNIASNSNLNCQEFFNECNFNSFTLINTNINTNNTYRQYNNKVFENCSISKLHIGENVPNYYYFIDELCEDNSDIEIYIDNDEKCANIISDYEGCMSSVLGNLNNKQLHIFINKNIDINDKNILRKIGPVGCSDDNIYGTRSIDQTYNNSDYYKILLNFAREDD